MRASPMLLGLSGLVLVAVTWISEPTRPTVGLMATLGLCALGGLVPLRIRGMTPLPLSLPLVGAVAVTGGAPEATAAGFLAGLATAIAPREDEEQVPSAALSAFAVAGAMAVAAGIVASGFSRFSLVAGPLGTPWAPAPDDLMKSLILVSAAFFLALEAARRVSRGDTKGPRAVFASALISTGAAAATILISAALLAADPRFVLSCVASSLITASLFGVALRRQERHARAARHRARTGITLVEALALAIEAKDRTSERHLRRMRVYCVAIGRRLGMPAEGLESLEYAALLHDIGKLVVPESILSKPAELSTEEFRLMSTHARIGAEILQTTSMSADVVAMVRHHHERYDGTGYPDGLFGMEIPLGARILAAVDTFEAFTSERPYREGLPVVDAIAYLERNAGSRFDPRVVRVLVEHHDEFERAVEAEERRNERAASPPAPQQVVTGVDTIKMGIPFQAVLDRIASSHMEIYSLHEIGQALGKTLNIDESLTLIMGKIRRLLHFSSCAIYLYDAEQETLRPRHASGPGASRIMQIVIPLGQRTSGWAALQRRTCLSAAPAGSEGRADGSRSDLCDISDDPEIAPLVSSLVAPIIVEDGLLGVIALYDDAAHEYTSQEEQLLALMSRQVAGAIRTTLLFEQTQEMALTDSLTGLPNSRYMFIAFDQEATRARAQGWPLTLMVMNVDGFHGINDDFGHHAGDRFLAGMAKAIRLQMRTCDTCIRYAADEFVAIVPRLAGAEVDAVADRLVEAARDYCMEARPGRAVRLTLSVGYATMPDDGDDFERLMAVAAARMQQQKRVHRNLPDDRSVRVPPGMLRRDRG